MSARPHSHRQWSKDDMLDKLAIVGMAIRLPEITSLDEFWQAIREARVGSTAPSDDELRRRGVEEALLTDPQFIRQSFVLEDIEGIDLALFSMTPDEARTMDPQLRLLLEAAWHAFENAGIDPGQVPNPTGVFAACGTSSYLLFHVLPRLSGNDHGELLRAMTLSEPDFAASWLSYRFDLTGPALGVRTACSSSLVALSQAAQSLLTWQCDSALVCASSVVLPQGTGYRFQEGSILSPDGLCRPFDAAANGTLNGNGAVAVVLKRLEDALDDGDRIDAVILGSAVNNDGCGKMGFMAPGPDGQAAVLAAALDQADVPAASIDMIEAHGTGTHLGDPVEFGAIRRVYGTEDRADPCRIGSLKANFGHLNTAAGLAGLVKAALCLKHRSFPPLANFKVANPALDLADGRFELPTQAQAWKTTDHPRRAAVSSFGFGGTNAHVVLEEGEAQDAGDPERNAECPLVVKLSAASKAALNGMRGKLAGWLRNSGHDADPRRLAATLNRGRADLAWRDLYIAADVAALANALERDQARALTSRERIVFAYSGQGSLSAGCAARDYATFPAFEERLNNCAEAFLSLGVADVLAYLVEGRDERSIAVHQAALFSLQWAVADLLSAWGISPDAVIGHSLGEYAAAVTAGILPFSDAARLVAARAAAMAELDEKGDMLAAMATPDRVETVARSCAPQPKLAAFNGPEQVSLAGPDAALQAFETKAAAEGIATIRLNTDAAFHSSLMAPAAERFRRTAGDVEPTEGPTPFLSTVEGRRLSGASLALDYWSRQITAPVRFHQAASEVSEDLAQALWVEIGPAGVLSGLIAQIHPAAGLVPGLQDGGLGGMLRGLYQNGQQPDWNAVLPSEGARPLDLPGYVFDRQRHWIEPPAQTVSEQLDQPSVSISDSREGDADLKGHIRQTVMECWQHSLGDLPLEGDSDFFAIGGNSLAAIRIVERLKAVCEVDFALADFMAARTVDAVTDRLVARIMADLGPLEQENRTC